MSPATSSASPIPDKKLLGVVSPEVASYFIAGGCAGAASRTVVSPLERLKIIQQVQPKGSAEYKGVWRSLVRMWKEEGFKGYMRGNGINCLRIVPYSAVQFTTQEQFKKVCFAYQLRTDLRENEVKVAPSIATSFFTYELSRFVLSPFHTPVADSPYLPPPISTLPEPRCCGQAAQRRIWTVIMSSDNALPPPVPRHARLQALQAAVATPRPCSSSLAHVMGQGFSKSPASRPQKGIAFRAFAARRKKSEDVTTKLSGGSSHGDREQNSLVDTSS
ncbi:hypothetical protein L218DRAFT_999811 [Marasmius fiardii PR-910]|nr:hypothetical protein L218DRAFT_999811 [Marasmius fiardii PR-910]